MTCYFTIYVVTVSGLWIKWLRLVIPVIFVANFVMQRKKNRKWVDTKIEGKESEMRLEEYMPFFSMN